MLNLKKIKVFSIVAAVFILTPMLVSAGVYFVDKNDSVAEGGTLVRPCLIDYPFTTCDTGKTPQNFCPTDSRYFKSCGCDTSVYKYTASNCTNNKTLGGNQCDGKYDACGCDAKYQYTTSNCTGGKALGGNTCDGKYETCGCDAAYSKTCSSPMIGGETDCDGKYKSCKCPVSYTKCDYGGEINAIKCTEEDGTVKWSTCKAATCETGGYVNSVPTNQTCTEVTYASKTCYKDCRAATCEDLGYSSTQANDKKCTYVLVSEGINPSDLASGSGCYKNCTDAPACSSGIGGGSIGANARISAIYEDQGMCTFKVAGNCNYAGFTASNTPSARASKYDFDLLIKHFSGSFTKIYSVGTTCGSSMTGYKIANDNVCILWYEPTYGSTCSQAGASSFKSGNSNVCYKCAANTSSGASSIANYVCYQAGTGNVVKSLTSTMEFCTDTYSMPRNQL